MPANSEENMVWKNVFSLGMIIFKYVKNVRLP